MSSRPSLEPLEPLAVYVPAPGSFAAAVVRDGSGLVSDGRTVDGKLVAYFQDTGFGDQESFRCYADRCYHAADRMLHAAPTIAKGMFGPDELVQVGWFDHKLGKVSLLEGTEQTLADWLGTASVAPAELETATIGVHHDRRAIERMLSSNDPAQQFAAKQLLELGDIDL